MIPPDIWTAFRAGMNVANGGSQRAVKKEGGIFIMVW